MRRRHPLLARKERTILFVVVIYYIYRYIHIMTCKKKGEVYYTSEEKVK